MFVRPATLPDHNSRGPPPCERGTRVDSAELSVEEGARRFETFAESAERIVGESTAISKPNRLARLRNHVFDHIGVKPVDKVTSSDVREVLAAIAAQGLSKDLVVHVRNDIGAVLGDLWRGETLPENVVARVKVPKAKVDTRERAVLTDEELLRYLAWHYPGTGHAMAVLERQTMASLSRMSGGVRVGDLRALSWEALDTEQGQFRFGWASRKKTQPKTAAIAPEVYNVRPAHSSQSARKDSCKDRVSLPRAPSGVDVSRPSGTSSPECAVHKLRHAYSK